MARNFTVFVLLIIFVLVSANCLATENSNTNTEKAIGRIALWPFEALGQASNSDALVVYTAITQYINKENERKVFSILDNSAKNSAPIEDYDRADCKSGRRYKCGFIHARKFNADTLVTGQLAKTGDVWILSLERINVKTLTTEASINRMVTGDFNSLLVILPNITNDLFAGYKAPRKKIVVIAKNEDIKPESLKPAASENDLLYKFEENEENEESENETEKSFNFQYYNLNREAAQKPDKTDDEQNELTLIPADEDPEPKRLRKDLVMIFNTVQPLKTKTFALDLQYVGVVDFAYQLTDSVKLGATTNVPVGIFAFMPHVTYSHKVSERSWLGFTFQAGFIAPLFLITDEMIYGFMGGPLYSLGTDRYSFNAGLRFVAGGVGDNFFDGALILATISATYQMTKIVGFGFDLNIPFKIDNGDSDISEFVAVLAYGITLQGKLAYGSLGFAGIFNKSWFEHLIQFMPLGIPYFRFGFVFE